MRIALLLSLLAAFFTLAGCPTQSVAPEFDTGPAPHDSGVSDANAVHDASMDAAHADAASDDAGLDAPADDTNPIDAATLADTNTNDANTSDANVVDANTNDANIPDANRADTGNACLNAGGSCVALGPTPCPGHSGGGLSCGPGLGIQCCLPGPEPAPVCMFVGTPQEGWYEDDGATQLCLVTVSCAGVTPLCQHVGTASAGWYTTGHGCSPHVDEIVHDDSCT